MVDYKIGKRELKTEFTQKLFSLHGNGNIKS